jgi:hypothetical protein
MDADVGGAIPPTDATAAAYVSALTVLRLGHDLLREASSARSGHPDGERLRALVISADARAVRTRDELAARGHLHADSTDLRSPAAGDGNDGPSMLSRLAARLPRLGARQTAADRKGIA